MEHFDMANYFYCAFLLKVYRLYATVTLIVTHFVLDQIFANYNASVPARLRIMSLYMKHLTYFLKSEPVEKATTFT